MELRKTKIDGLKPALYNPRKDLQPGDPEYQKIKRSIEEFGYVDPIIINKDMTVIGGHQRLKVLKEMGYTEIDCVVVDLNKTKEKALNIALNKISGDWDFTLLKELLGELEEGEMELTGFDMDEIDEILGINNDPVDIDDILESLDMDKAVERPIWITARTSFKNLEIFEKAARVLEKHGIRVERSYEME